MAVTESYVKADPYHWPYNGDLRPGEHGADRHRHADRFLRQGRLCRQAMGYDLSHDPSAPIEADQVGAGGDARGVAIHIIHTREGHRPDLSDLPANKRWRSPADRRRHRRSRPMRKNPGARREGLGHHPRTLSRTRRDRSSTSQARVVSARPISTCCSVSKRHRQSSSSRGITTDVCVSHHHARGERSRLSNACRARRLLRGDRLSAITRRRSRWSRCRAASSVRSPTAQP